MFLIIGVLLALAAVVIALRRRGQGEANADLGWMSEQWLAEHRASHSS